MTSNTLPLTALTLNLLLGLFALGVPSKVSARPEGFRPLTAGPRSVAFLESDSGRCTAVAMLSPRIGLTARHCLQRCLIRNKIFVPLPSQGVTHYALDPATLGKTTCDASINGQKQELTIEATSRFLIIPMDETSFQMVHPELFRQLVDHGATSRGDFVVFRTDKPFAQSAALPASHPVVLGDSVLTVGYPSETSRGDGFDSDGSTTYRSEGRVTAGIEENSCLREASPSSARIEGLRSRFNESTAFVSTVDAIYGSSGSPVFDDRGEIAGILTNVYRHASLTRSSNDEPERRYCRGSAKALRIERIMDMIAEIRPGWLSELARTD